MNCAEIGPSLSANEVVIDGHWLPNGILSVLRVSDGLITKGRLFRVFGTQDTPEIPSIRTWNGAEWKKSYGVLARGLVFVAEDIFGDQYGYRYNEDGSRNFVKFFCEGGQTEEVNGGINHLIQALIDPAEASLVDIDLAKEASHAGLAPTANEHLAFRVPLVIGGPREIENLATESVMLHLGTLAQLVSENSKRAEGSAIRRFKE